MYRIKKSVLEDVLGACRNLYPKEFLALIGSKMENEVVDEFIVLPADFGDSFSAVYLNMKPFDRKIIGSVHSHPNSCNRPSSGDLMAFPKYGKIHLIIGHPYNMKSAALYDSLGKRMEFEVIE